MQGSKGTHSSSNNNKKMNGNKAGERAHKRASRRSCECDSDSNNNSDEIQQSWPEKLERKNSISTHNARERERVKGKEGNHLQLSPSHIQYILATNLIYCTYSKFFSSCFSITIIRFFFFFFVSYCVCVHCAHAYVCNFDFHSIQNVVLDTLAHIQ